VAPEAFLHLQILIPRKVQLNNRHSCHCCCLYVADHNVVNLVSVNTALTTDLFDSSEIVIASANHFEPRLV